MWDALAESDLIPGVIVETLKLHNNTEICYEFMGTIPCKLLLWSADKVGSS